MPGISKNLIFVGKLATQPGISLLFVGSKYQILEEGKLKAQGMLLEDLYLLKMFNGNLISNKAYATTTHGKSHMAERWHARLGHLGQKRMHTMATMDIYKDRLDGDYTQLPFCVTCIQAKHH